MKRAGLIFLGVVLSLSGCKKRPVAVSLPPPPIIITVPAPAPEPAPPPAPEPAPPPAPPPAPGASILEAAHSAFSAGALADAARSYESYLRIPDAREGREEALFRLGLIYALPETPNRDWVRAAGFLKQLIDEFPRSPLRPSATLILTLYLETNQLRADSQQREQRIKQLSTELENLKKIDAQRRKP